MPTNNLLNNPLDTLLDTLLDKIATALVIFDQSGHFVYLNQAAEKELSVSKSQLLGEHYSFFIAKESLPLGKILVKLNQQESFLQDDFELVLNNGLSFKADFHIQQIDSPAESQSYDQTGKQLLVEWQNREIIAKHASEQQLKVQNDATNQLLQQLAHEIKNPLSGIRGAAQLLAMEIPPSQQEFTKIIQTEIDRLAKLVDRMLLPAKKSSRVLVNIHQIIEQVIQLCTIEKSSDIQIIKDYDPSLPELMLSPELIYQALLNLVQNALDACALEPTRKGKIIIKTRAALQKTIADKQYPLTLQIDIIDNGVGIDPKIASNIFLPLISGKNSTGLGLGIAQSLIQQHQGLIEASSTQDSDTNNSQTTFSVFLPLITDPKEVN